MKENDNFGLLIVGDLIGSFTIFHTRNGFSSKNFRGVGEPVHSNQRFVLANFGTHLRLELMTKILFSRRTLEYNRRISSTFEKI